MRTLKEFKTNLLEKGSGASLQIKRGRLGNPTLDDSDDESKKRERKTSRGERGSDLFKKTVNKLKEAQYEVADGDDKKKLLQTLLNKGKMLNSTVNNSGDSTTHFEHKGELYVVNMKSRRVESIKNLGDVGEADAKKVISGLKEDSVGADAGLANNHVGTPPGNIAGVSDNDPPVDPEKKKKKKSKDVLRHRKVNEETDSTPSTTTPASSDTFAGGRVFDVDSDTFSKCRCGKGRYDRYSKYLDVKSSPGKEIHEYGRSSKGQKIILRDKSTNHMLYLKFSNAKGKK
jgi:hypothetical protein